MHDSKGGRALRVFALVPVVTRDKVVEVAALERVFFKGQVFIRAQIVNAERSDFKAKNLAQEYPEFNKVHGSTTLGTLKDRFDVDSLNQVHKVLRNL